ncbi:hypothetical protein HN358_04425 [Candidatus Uhrbacteria bacterium]|nr:hypothetical protein [Candidatus Uhrbacteria bacterium]MBT7717029.1 hypothetical protein [Candidatus Uhrbacteria bacterium]
MKSATPWELIDQLTGDIHNVRASLRITIVGPGHVVLEIPEIGLEQKLCPGQLPGHDDLIDQLEVLREQNVLMYDTTYTAALSNDGKGIIMTSKCGPKPATYMARFAELCDPVLHSINSDLALMLQAWKRLWIQILNSPMQLSDQLMECARMHFDALPPQHPLMLRLAQGTLLRVRFLPTEELGCLGEMAQLALSDSQMSYSANENALLQLHRMHNYSSGHTPIGHLHGHRDLCDTVLVLTQFHGLIGKYMCMRSGQRYQTIMDKHLANFLHNMTSNRLRRAQQIADMFPGQWLTPEPTEG